MGRLPTGERQYHVQMLQERHREIIRLLVLGWENTRIAEHLQITPQNVSDVRNSDLTQERIVDLRNMRDEATADVQRTVAAASMKAAALMEQLVDDDPKLLASNTDIRLRMKAAADVLDRAGHKPATVVQGAMVHTVVTSEDIERLRARTISAGRASGMIVEAEAVAVEV